MVARPSHVVLAPGLRVIPHGRDAVQIGLDPSRAIRLPRTPELTQALQRLALGTNDEDTLEVLDPLARQGYLVESASLTSDRHLAALALVDPSGFTDRARRRSTARVGISGTLDPRQLLEASGLRVVTHRPDVVLIAQVGELCRATVDPLIAAEVPHVVVRLLDGVAIIGPFVEPGRTACLRCLDAHAAENDPGLPARIEAYAAATAVPRLDGTAEPVDSALATMALAWAVRDLLSHVDGLRPSTWSSTVRLSATLATVEAVSWLRHPSCSCNWTTARSDPASATLEA